jgi:hypothetical protein
LIRAAEEAVDALDAENRAEAQAALDRIRSAGYSADVVEAEAAVLWRRHGLRLASVLVRQVGDAARMADRVAAEQTAGARGTYAPASRTRGLQGGARASVEAAISGSVDAPLVAPGTAVRPPPAALRTPGGKLLESLAGPQKPEVALSERLHGSVARAQSEAMQAIRRVVTEGHSLDASGKALILEVRKAGAGEFGQGQRVPKLLRDLRQSGNRLAQLGTAQGTPAHRAATLAWKRDMARLDRHVYGREGAGGRRITLQHGDLPDYLGHAKGGLADTRGAYAELRQILQAKGPAAMDRAIGRWTAEKQRENAERIIRTEVAAAYRARQVRQWRASGAILGVVWRLNQGSRRRYVARVPVRRSGPHAGRRCICESMAGHLMSLDEAAQWPRMGHPHCACWWEPRYRSGARGGPIAQDELDELAE